MHQRLSRCWMCLIVSAATSDRRSPQPNRTASIARSRSPFFVDTSGAFRSVCACRTDSQFPTLTPFDLAPFTRVMPAASSGASSPLSAASTASFRTAVIRTLMEMGPSPWASSAIRQAPTVAFVKPYVKGQNSAAQDAAAICEASSRPEMRFAPQKLIGQQDLQALHRIRIRLISVTGRSWVTKSADC